MIYKTNLTLCLSPTFFWVGFSLISSVKDINSLNLLFLQCEVFNKGSLIDRLALFLAAVMFMSSLRSCILSNIEFLSNKLTFRINVRTWQNYFRQFFIGHIFRLRMLNLTRRRPWNYFTIILKCPGSSL